MKKWKLFGNGWVWIKTTISPKKQCFPYLLAKGIYLPKKARAFITSKFRGQEIYEIAKKKRRLWI